MAAWLPSGSRTMTSGFSPCRMQTTGSCCPRRGWWGCVMVTNPKEDWDEGVVRSECADAGGQGPAAGGRHGPGADVRAGLSELFVWLPAGTVGTSGAGGLVAARDGPGWLQLGGGGYPEVFRHPGSSPFAGVSSAAGA